MKIQFSVIGLIIFILPMIINIVYFLVAPKNGGEESTISYKWVEWVEQITRIIFMITICLLVSKQETNFKSPWMILAVVFLVLYYIVWIRYFAGGMEESLMIKSFMFVPNPLAVFPVLYFLCSAIWLHNYVAAGFMIVFGISHFVVSYLNLTK